MQGLWQDFRYGVRMLRKSPGFAVIAILTIALGIGANTSIFSLMDQVLLRLLPVADPERLVVFHSEGHSPGLSTSDVSQTVFSYPMYQDLCERQQVFQGIIARAGAPISMSYGGQTERAQAEMVSGNFFEVLGVQAAEGRLFSNDDDRMPGGHPVVIINYGYWTRRFGANASILNQTLLINQHPMTVVGIGPREFSGVIRGQKPDLWIPISMKSQVTPTWDGLRDRRVMWLNLLARLNPGISAQQAEAAIQTVYRPILEEELAQMGPMRNEQSRVRFLEQRLQLLPATQGINQLRLSWQTPLLVLAAMVGLVLLIACVNVAGLLLARAASRQKEMAIRLATGASRIRILRQLLVESLLLAVAGGLVGLIIGRWTTEALLQFLPQGTENIQLSAQIDLRLLGFGLLLAILTGLLFGMAPAVQTTRMDVAGMLKVIRAGVTGQTRLRRVLVVSQVALSLLLLVAAGLFALSLFNLRHFNAGFRVQNLWSFSVDPSLNGYSRERGFVFYQELQNGIAEFPGVEAVGSAQLSPLSNSRRSANVTVEGYQAKDDEDLGCDQNTVGPGYFRTVGIPLIVGREFTDRDHSAAPKVVIVNEAFAKFFFGDQNPIGRHIAFGAGNRIKLDREIVGVVRNSRHANLREPIHRFVYMPYAQDEDLKQTTFFVRAGGNATTLASQIRQAVLQMDSNLPVFDMKSLELQLSESIYTDRLVAALSAAFGILATLLAAVGLYGLMAFTVTRRTNEIGIRMALGAMKSDVLWLVMKEVTLLTITGSAIGLLLALGLCHFLESQLFGLTPTDPIVFAGAIVLLAFATLLAGYIPARRAARVGPMVALRYE